ncbi:GPW/gp25 family protein [Paludibacteraceae bacterium OttesenSCG-928-F17]|nr:GPW/gp25 family protein [Paludibacteraceae bacterium OttesenSCG-928-F17]
MSWQLYIKDPSQIVEGKEDIAQSIYLILATVKGSDPLRPLFGSDLYKYIDKPLAENKPMIVYAATDAIEKWEKRVKLLKCGVSQDNTGKITLTLHIDIIGSGETTLTINI